MPAVNPTVFTILSNGTRTYGSNHMRDTAFGIAAKEEGLYATTDDETSIDLEENTSNFLSLNGVGIHPWWDLWRLRKYFAYAEKQIVTLTDRTTELYAFYQSVLDQKRALEKTKIPGEGFPWWGPLKTLAGYIGGYGENHNIKQAITWLERKIAAYIQGGGTDLNFTLNLPGQSRGGMQSLKIAHAVDKFVNNYNQDKLPEQQMSVKVNFLISDPVPGMGRGKEFEQRSFARNGQSAFLFPSAKDANPFFVSRSIDDIAVLNGKMPVTSVALDATHSALQVSESDDGREDKEAYTFITNFTKLFFRNTGASAHVTEAPTEEAEAEEGAANAEAHSPDEDDDGVMITSKSAAADRRTASTFRKPSTATLTQNVTTYLTSQQTINQIHEPKKGFFRRFWGVKFIADPLLRQGQTDGVFSLHTLIQNILFAERPKVTPSTIETPPEHIQADALAEMHNYITGTKHEIGWIGRPHSMPATMHEILTITKQAPGVAVKTKAGLLSGASAHRKKVEELAKSALSHPIVHFFNRTLKGRSAATDGFYRSVNKDIWTLTATVRETNASVALVKIKDVILSLTDEERSPAIYNILEVIGKDVLRSTNPNYTKAFLSIQSIALETYNKVCATERDEDIPVFYRQISRMSLVNVDAFSFALQRAIQPQPAALSF